MISAHAVLAAAAARTDTTAAETPSLPPVMEQALTEFGLLPAFRRRPVALQRQQVDWIAESGSEAVRHSRIASVLDELAMTSPSYRKNRRTF